LIIKHLYHIISIIPVKDMFFGGGMMSEELEEKARKILGVNNHATIAELKQAYWRLAMEYHPDKKPGDKESEKMFNLISEAYEILTKASHNQGYSIRNHEESPSDWSYIEWWIEKYKDYI
jgi:hypothetical protein